MRVQLPGVAAASAIELDVAGQQLALAVPGRFRLQLALPHAVDAARCRASFAREQQLLALTLPVLPPQAPPLPARAEAAASAGQPHDDVLLGEEAKEGCAPAAAGSCEQQEDACCSSSAGGSSGEGPESCGSSGPVAEQQLTENQRKWAELHGAGGRAVAAAGGQVQPGLGHATGRACFDSHDIHPCRNGTPRGAACCRAARPQQRGCYSRQRCS